MNEIKSKPSVSNNYILNLLVNVFSMLVPVITTPYISRALGSESIGIYSYCLSIETYFVVLGSLGIPTYAKREIASVRNDKNKLNRTFSELLIMQVVLIILSLALYIIFAIFINSKYRLMFSVCGLGIFAAIFDVSWLFLGVEDFKTIVRRSVVFKAICVALIFLFVKKPEDLYIYALSLMSANLLCNFWLIFSSKKIIKFQRPSFNSILKHFKPSLFLLLPSMVTTVYAVIDKTMLGMISKNMSEVGYYEQSQKIVTLSLTLITSLGAVLMPRLAALFSEGKKSEFNHYINKGISAICFVSLPLAVGCFIVSDNLVPWFYGPGFEKITILLKIFSPMLFFMGLSDLIGVQAFVALRKEKQLLIINIATTAINLILNAILIPHFLCVGAAFATLISELIKCVVFIVLGYRYIEILSLIKSLLKYSVIAIIMGISLFFIQSRYINSSSIINTIVLVIIGGLIYLLCLLILKDNWLNKCFEVAIKLTKKIKKKY